ncbi:anthrone oxygenase family protein [Paenibacillus planticolens]|nr:anthrone oxygenase family protein [Paenibacillus planticolens]
MYQIVIEFVSLFLTGILAGEEFVVRYGVHASLAHLDEQSQIRVRQALILKLRVLVPAIILPTVVSAVAVLILNRYDSGFGFQCAGALALLILILTTIFGTLPINKGLLLWRPDAPPSNWKQLINRWALLDVVRSSAAILAFAFFLTAVALQLTGK